MDLPQQQFAAAQDGLVDRIYELFTANVISIIALACVGMLVSVGTVAGLRVILKPVDDAPLDVRARRALFLKRAGFCTGAVWTFLIVLGYITASNLIAKITVALGVAVIAGAGTPYAYDVLRWTWRTLVPAIGQWILGKFKSMFGSKSPPEAAP